MSIDPFCLSDEMHRGVATKKETNNRNNVSFRCCDVESCIHTIHCLCDAFYNTLAFRGFWYFAIHCHSVLSFDDSIVIA